MKQEPTQVTIREAYADDGLEFADVFDATFSALRSIYRPAGQAIARQSARADEGTRLVVQVDGRIAETVQFAAHRKHDRIILAWQFTLDTNDAASLVDWLSGSSRRHGNSATVSWC